MATRYKIATQSRAETLTNKNLSSATNTFPAATTTSTGVVEKSTSAENIAGTSDTVYPTVAGTKEMIDTHGGGGSIWTELYNTTLGASTATMDTGTFAGYDYLRIVLEKMAHTHTASAHVYMRFNGDSTAGKYSYSMNVEETEVSASETDKIFVGYSVQDYEYVYQDILLHNVSSSYKRGFGLSGGRFRNNGQQVTNGHMLTTCEFDETTNRVTSIQFSASSGNIEAGSIVKIYGSSTPF